MEARTRIKICGITNEEDARLAVGYGADALGVILVSESPRYVTSHRIFNSIASQALGFAYTVGVCEDLLDAWPLVPGATPVVQAALRILCAVQYYSNRTGSK